MQLVFFSKIRKMIGTPLVKKFIRALLPFSPSSKKIDKMTDTPLSCSKFLNGIMLHVKAGYFDVKIGHFLVNVFTVTV